MVSKGIIQAIRTDYGRAKSSVMRLIYGRREW
ncbi:MAG: hypothetical protein E5299_00893 [Burkholderia gladioli]|nr:MAG: hypothetical protein E5299_00893 [Burkholderia gladioli]